MKKIVTLICLIVAFCCCSAVALAEDKIVVGISTPTADHTWTGGVVWWSEQAVKEFEKKYPNIEFIYKTSASDKDQAADVETMLAKKIQALVILPHKPAPLTTVLNKVNNTGAFIVVLDRSIPKVPKNVYLAGDNYGFGFKCGEYLASALRGQGNILVMEGMPCEGNTLRIKGFKAALRDHPGVVIMDSQPAYWNPAVGYELMRGYLREFQRIDAIWCGDDDVLEGARKAYDESGRDDIKFFLGGGGSKRIIKHIIDGDPLLPATVTYPPKMAYEAIQLAVERLVDGKSFPKEITIASELVTKENAKDFYYPDSVY